MQHGGDARERLRKAADELLVVIDRELNPTYVSVATGEEAPIYSIEHRTVREDWQWGSFYDGVMHYSPPAPLAILWEEGPDDWTTELTIGRTHRQVLALQQKYDVLFEPYTSWALGIYDTKG